MKKAIYSLAIDFWWPKKQSADLKIDKFEEWREKRMKSDILLKIRDIIKFPAYVKCIRQHVRENRAGKVLEDIMAENFPTL